MKIISWNVNGIRAVQTKGFTETLAHLDADCILLQETKAQADQIDKALEGIDHYHIYNNCAERKGYSGVTIMSRHEPLQIIHDIGIAEHDQEGRVIVAEFEQFYLLNVYVPNSGEVLARLDYRKTWDAEFLAYCQQLQSKKPLIACGDFNVAHQEIEPSAPQASVLEQPFMSVDVAVAAPTKGASTSKAIFHVHMRCLLHSLPIARDDHRRWTAGKQRRTAAQSAGAWLPRRSSGADPTGR